ncbi:MAG: hypothetical protein U0175_04230 [Caldilineaceae bacterium]
MTMIAHKVEATVDQNGSITLTNLPFASGEAIEVILMRKQPLPRRAKKRKVLKGALIKYIDPFAPVALEDWDALS